MPKLETILALPALTLIVLAAGYFGYRVAYIGRDKKHRVVDIIFIVIAFGLIARLVAEQVSVSWGQELLQSIAAIVVVVGVASFWRKWGEGWLRQILRLGNISLADGHTSVFDSMQQKVDLQPAQLLVRKKNGSQAMSNDLHQFNDLPFGPCLYGEDGSIGMYVTHRRDNSDGEWVVLEPVHRPSTTAAFTYFPADEISEIEKGYIVTSLAEGGKPASG